jgi:nucleotide-binding universal stress UspA family protein
MYNTILVPLDGSKRAEAILSHVEELARHYSDARVILLQVVESISRYTDCESDRAFCVWRQDGW